MAHTQVNCHDVASLQAGPVRELRRTDDTPFWTRSILATAQDGGLVELTVFSHTSPDALAILEPKESPRPSYAQPA